MFDREEIGFGFVTDSPKEAVDLIVHRMLPGMRDRLRLVQRQEE